MRMFENRVLKRTFESKRQAIKAGWRKLCNEKLYDL
jgi:hypothetical protein